MQKQLTRDFTPIWGLRATLDTFDDLASVPSDYHPIVIFGYAEELVGQVEAAIGPEYTARLVDDFERGRLTGLHLNAFTRQPFALVEASDAWSVTVSHEVLEMIADPYGNRLIAAAHPLDRERSASSTCSRSATPARRIWYPVNGVPVSDFYTPRYFDPVSIPGGRYSYTGSDRAAAADPRGRLPHVDRPRGLGALHAHRGRRRPGAGGQPAASSRAAPRRCGRSSTRRADTPQADLRLDSGRPQTPWRPAAPTTP